MDLDDQGISKKFLWRSHKINFCQKKKVINLKTRAKRSSKRKEKKRKEKKKKRVQCDKAVKLPKTLTG